MTITVSQFRLTVFETPGHTPGSLIFVCNELKSYFRRYILLTNQLEQLNFHLEMKMICSKA
jgi:hypothetical protein